MKGHDMQKQIGRNTKALSTLMLIILLLASAIIGGILAYLWVTGYYVSLKERIPDKNSASIVDVSFRAQNATAFNVTILNPSYSPDINVTVEAIVYSLKGDTTLQIPSFIVPVLPHNISRGDSETFFCKLSTNWGTYVNKTLVVSVFVENGIGSTAAVTLPYTKLWIENVDFNAALGIQNFTVTLKNDQQSATYLNVTKIFLDEVELTNLTTPKLPFTLYQDQSAKLFTCNYNWSSYAAGGDHTLYVRTLQGYTEAYGVRVPTLAYSVQEINFNLTDMTHFNVTVKSQVSTNNPLNVSRIELLLDNGTRKNYYFSSPINAVPPNQTATFTCDWDWTNYRNRNVIATVYMTQGIYPESGQQTTPPAAILSIPEPPAFPDTQHFFITIKNSDYPGSIKTANVTKITVKFENGTEKQITIVQPSSGPYLIRVGETMMFSCLLNWENYLDKDLCILVYTNETSLYNPLYSSYNTLYTVRTPSSTSNYYVNLTVPWTMFNATNTAQFDVNVTNNNSNRDANITRIEVMLENGTIINVTPALLPYLLPINSTTIFTCNWDWSSYHDKNVTIRIYTTEGNTQILRTFYKTKTPP
jgi:hypothetical protein